jgi:hypothetical protein
MKYLLAIYRDNENRWNELSPEEQKAGIAAYERFTADAAAAGVLLGGEALQPTSAATTVTVRDGERQVTDGPFVETKEQLGGYFLVDCQNLDEALDWAARCPAAGHGTIEVRPIQEYPSSEQFESRAGNGSAVA